LPPPEVQANPDEKSLIKRDIYEEMTVALDRIVLFEITGKELSLKSCNLYYILSKKTFNLLKGLKAIISSI